ncbi:MAG: type II toxin-antitoxin system HicB family antitoxin [Gemmatimonadota bacterium]|nr:type II toxin-antitoxin system HicB family antitoxin [Gemmatimonadota bacterium]
MATLEYKGYIARIDADEGTNGFHGWVINISDVVNFKGRSMAELKREFAKSMEVYFAFCREEGGEPEQPFSGRFVLRVDPSLHRAITRAAEREGVSINKWAATALEHAAKSGQGLSRSLASKH